MIKSAILVLVAASLASAQLAHVPQRARTDGKVVPSGSDSAFGRQANLRSNHKQPRMLEEGSMSMSMTFEDVDAAPPASTEEETAAVEVCGKGGECSEGYYCQCRLACFLCEAFGGDFCGTCKLEA